MARKNNVAAQATVIINAQEDTMAAQNTAQAQVTVNAAEVQEDSTMDNTAQATAQVIEDALNQAKEEEVMDEKQMSKLEAMMKGIMQGLVSGKKFVGQTKATVVEGLDDDVEQVKASMFYVTNVLGDITGMKQFREDVMTVLESGYDQGTLNSITSMATEVRELFKARIEKLNALGSEESLKKAMELSKGCNILEYGIVALIWAAKNISKKLKEWFGIDTEKLPTVLKAICAGIKAVFGFAWTVGKIVVTVVGRVLSYAVAGIIKLAAWIVNTVKTLYFKAKAFVQGKIQDIKAKADEEEFEDDFDDEDLETC